jgi:hypothetical protein
VVTRVLALAVLMAAAPALVAGCAAPAAGDADADGAGPAKQPPLQAGKGAIQGLLVDDRYRPLHLTDEPQGEYDAAGFILVVETGESVRSDADGVFQVLDLELGTVTLKPSVEGHEGAPLRVDVTAGEYAEVDVLVRRLLTPGKDTIVIHDDTILISCSVQTLDGHFTVGKLCHGDLSANDDTNFIDYNYTAFGAISAVVVEVQLSRTVDFEMWMTKQTNLINGPELYGKIYAYDSSYLRHQALDGNETGRFGGSPVDTMDLRVWVNVNGPGTQEADELTGLPVGADFTFVIEARVVVSAFIEAPADLDTYAVLA